MTEITGVLPIPLTPLTVGLVLMAVVAGLGLIVKPLFLLSMGANKAKEIAGSYTGRPDIDDVYHGPSTVTGSRLADGE